MRRRERVPGPPPEPPAASSWFRGWAVRVLAWSLILAVPCWLLSPAYERGLGTVVKAVIDAFGHSLQIDKLEVFVPFEIGVFVSMCLASRRAPVGRRIRAIALGVPLLAALEVVVMVATTFVILSHQSGALAGDFYKELPRNLPKTIGWVNALALWMVILGGWEAPDPARSAAGTGKGPGSARAVARPLPEAPPDR